MTSGLIGFELSFEQTLLHAAIQAERSGDHVAAIGYMRSCARCLGMGLPNQPVPIGNAIDNYGRTKKYIFDCLDLLGIELEKKMTSIRKSYNPVSFKAKPKGRENGSAATQ